MAIQANLESVAADIPAGRKLIAVSKTQPPEKILEAFQAGQRAFGENRAQEMAKKFDMLPKAIEWHMIGHLQTNKVKYIAPFVHLIHSADTPRLLEEINRQAARANRIIRCLLQVHIAEEETKFGFSAEEITELAGSEIVTQWGNIQIEGLMGMATFTDNTAQVRREFRGLKMLFDRLASTPLPPSVKMRELSMGMSGDYKIALEEGSTMVRVGTAIFGERKL